ncbi:MAG: MoaD/ThiS family protein [Chloroflexi bacterium]|nr:MoaD/ThiS family protein [Chloroflexota bacterium]
MVSVWVPALLRSLCGGAARLEVEGGTLGDVLRALDLRCPGLYDRVVEGGRVRPELAVAINGEVLSLALHEPLAPGTELTLVPAIGGG